MKRTVIAAVLFTSVAALAADAIPFRGVVEGYYGRPWGTEGRISMLKFMGENGLNMFIYGPKDDPYHHDKWREPYPAQEISDFAKLLECARNNKVSLYWAIHLGGTFSKGSEDDYAALFRKLGLMYDAGFRAFAVFFDDFGGADAAFHAEICNRVVRDFLSKHADCAPLVMCPNAYWSYGTPYHRTLGETLDPSVMVMWTGRTICSDIRSEDVERITKDLRRPPLVWWNWPVNDYCRSSLLLGRTYGLDNCTLAGIVSNPMENCEASKVALFGFAKWCADPDGFDSRKCWEESFSALYRDPRIASAMRIFAEHNSDQGPNVHGYRREESASAAPLCAAANAELDREGRLSVDTAKALKSLFGNVYRASKVLHDKLPKERYDLGWEINGWVENEIVLMAQGGLALKLLDAKDAKSAAPMLLRLRTLRKTEDASARRHCEKFAAATFAADSQRVKRPVASARELRPLVEKLQLSALGRLYEKKFGRKFVADEGMRAFSKARSLRSPTVSRQGKYAMLARVMEPLAIAPGESFGISLPKSWETDYFHARLGTAEASSAGVIEVSKDGTRWTKLETRNNGGEMQLRLNPADGWRHARYRNTSNRKVTVKLDLFKFDLASASEPIDMMIGELL